MSKALSIPGYAAFLSSLKERIRHSRTSAAHAVSYHLVSMYWDIGRSIVEKKHVAGWGDAVVERISADLRAEFPGMQGFSRANLFKMQQLYLDHTTPDFLSQAVEDLQIDGKKVSQAVRQLAPGKPIPEVVSQAVRQLVASVPWGHHTNILAKISDPQARIY